MRVGEHPRNALRMGLQQGGFHESTVGSSRAPGNAGERLAGIGYCYSPGAVPSAVSGAVTVEIVNLVILVVEIYPSDAQRAHVSVGSLFELNEDILSDRVVRAFVISPQFPHLPECRHVILQWRTRPVDSVDRVGVPFVRVDMILVGAHIIRTARISGRLRRIDLLTAKAGSVNHPHTTQIAMGDGTWIPSMYKNGSQQTINPKTGKVRRFDPDAVPYHTPDGKITRGAYGRQLVLASVRGPHRNERIILGAAFKPPGKSDATIFTDMILNMRKRRPHLRKSLHGVVYDMALHATDIDRFLDNGIIPISKVQRTKGDKPAAVNLGEHTFTTFKGTNETAEIIALDGTPCITVTNETGSDSYMPLKRVHTQLNRHINVTTVYGTWQVPDHPLTPPTLVGATTRIRHNSTTEERKHHKRRTRALRVIPEGTDPDFDRLFGLREDPESTNSHLKSLLPNGRARTATTSRQTLNHIAYRINIMVKALISHHQRTGIPLQYWLGEHQPRVRAGPAKAA